MHARSAQAAGESGASEQLKTAPEPKYRVPKNEVEMIQDCADAIGRAQAAGINRHKIRLMLPGGEAPSWGTLCPTDESWEGGKTSTINPQLSTLNPEPISTKFEDRRPRNEALDPWP